MDATSKQLRVLVTGAGGYIGRFAVNALMKRGCHVIAADIRPIEGCTASEQVVCDIFSGEENMYIEPCWPGHLAEGVIATTRGEYVFLQNTTDAVVWFKNAELAPYATAIYKKEGSALKCVYNQLAFTWKPV